MNECTAVLLAIHALARQASAAVEDSGEYDAIASLCADMLAQSGLHPPKERPPGDALQMCDLEEELRACPSLHPKVRQIGEKLLLLWARDSNLKVGKSC